ncbi:hypothetical protein Q5P01_002892 [Channa striata]|uniref:G-protein coupled receptors family 1 profile domain-containing protein n=1 Tax=Channa striata TaxID=64152 RepID=A0AA88T8J0_CHASR|nr:hypothetical protein Q5P01_002892 [Channa striata]
MLESDGCEQQSDHVTATNMAANSSSSVSYLLHCSDFTVGVVVISAFLFTKLSLLLPLSLLVLFLGVQRWRRQRSFATTSHSDIFTYNSAALELIYVLGVISYYCGKEFRVLELMTLGYLYFFSPVLPGETCFHILTCVERYLAVVHPVTYLTLRQSGGVRIRNISVGTWGNGEGQGSG